MTLGTKAIFLKNTHPKTMILANTPIAQELIKVSVITIKCFLPFLTCLYDSSLFRY